MHHPVITGLNVNKNSVVGMMNFRVIRQICLQHITSQVILAADVDQVLSLPLNALKLIRGFIVDSVVNVLFSKSPACLPSIYLFNLKQTKLFAFIID